MIDAPDVDGEYLDSGEATDLEIANLGDTLMYENLFLSWKPTLESNVDSCGPAAYDLIGIFHDLRGSLYVSMMRVDLNLMQATSPDIS